MQTAQREKKLNKLEVGGVLVQEKKKVLSVKKRTRPSGTTAPPPPLPAPPLQGWRLPYISGMMKTEMSSPEPRRSLVILQPRSLRTPRALMTRSCAAIVYLNNRGEGFKSIQIRCIHMGNTSKEIFGKGLVRQRKHGNLLSHVHRGPMRT